MREWHNLCSKDFKGYSEEDLKERQREHRWKRRCRACIHRAGETSSRYNFDADINIFAEVLINFQQFEEWVILFAEYLENFIRTKKDFNQIRPSLKEMMSLFGSLFNNNEINSKIDFFVNTCISTHNIKSEDFFHLFHKSKNYRSLLTDDLLTSTKVLSKVMIHCGLKYYFRRRYFSTCVNFLLHNNLVINGRFFHTSFCPRLFKSPVSIRRQLCIELILCLFSKLKLNYERVLTQLWRAIPYPYITAEEMHQLFLPYYRVVPGNATLEQVCEAYKESNIIFPIPEKKEPRSLKHLSKVKIRNTIVKYNNIISDKDIESLHLPSLLKDYLKLNHM